MFEFSTCQSLVCGAGVSANLPEIAGKLGIKKMLVVTDPGLIKAGLVERVTAPLADGSVQHNLFSAVVPDPPESLVLEVAQIAKNEKIDGVLGLGGGSSMDVAKLVSVLCDASQPLSEMYGIDQIKEERLPLIQIPTTAGTGSEVTPISIITTGETTKTGVVSPKLLPDFAILDPELTVGLPSHVTAATGVDAMVHAIEAYTSKLRKNPYSDMLAVQALKLLYENLELAVRDGGDIIAREKMLLGAMLAGQAFANAPVAAIHALAYPLGGHYHIPHGLSNSLVLPPVMRFNLAGAKKHYSELAAELGLCSRESDPLENSNLFLEALIKLIDAVGLPTKLRECGVNGEDLPMLAKDAMLQTRLLVNNPVEVLEEDALKIYDSIF